jgi:hypothetical protein
MEHRSASAGRENIFTLMEVTRVTYDGCEWHHYLPALSPVMSFEKSEDNFKQRTASVGVRSSMNVTRAMSRDNACNDRTDDDDDAGDDDAADDSLGKCHILTVLSAAAVTKPPRGKSGNLRGNEHGRLWRLR